MDNFNYWRHWHNIRYEIFSKRKERVCMWIARNMPTRIRVWVVVDSTNEARQLYPDPEGYAGPDGLGYKEIYDGARRTKT